MGKNYTGESNKYIVNSETTVILGISGGEILIDTCDIEKTKNYKWIVNNGYSVASYKVNDGYKTIYMHRTIMNAPKGIDVDHINHNKLDNRKINLRLVDECQNLWNMKTPITNKSGTKGVSFYSARNRWEAGIKVRSKKIHLGKFKNIEDAIKARKEAEIKYHGEYRFISQEGS